MYEDLCDFNISYGCPFCNKSLSNGLCKELDGDVDIKCGHCSSGFPLKKMKYLMENGLIVDFDIRCILCNGPTIHRNDINLSNRCFNYPKCSGQKGLFGQEIESLTFLDFETTGLEVGKESIIEIGALKEQFLPFVIRESQRPTKHIDATKSCIVTEDYSDT